MKSLAVLKRVLLATAVVIAFLGFARPAAAIGPGLKYFYIITALPNWGLGNPQPVSSWSALTALGPGAPTAPENFVSLGLLGYPGSWYAYDTFLGETNGFIGADVSVPTAQWITPAAYYWTGGPAGGGALGFFNTFNPFTGIYYANEMIVLDPPSCADASTCLADLENELGFQGSLPPSLVNLDANGDPEGVTLPGDDYDADVNPDPSAADIFADGSQQIDTPEGPTAIYVVLGILAVGGGVYFRRRRRPLLPAA